MNPAASVPAEVYGHCHNEFNPAHDDPGASNPTARARARLADFSTAQHDRYNLYCESTAQPAALDHAQQLEMTEPINPSG